MNTVDQAFEIHRPSKRNRRNGFCKRLSVIGIAITIGASGNACGDPGYDLVQAAFAGDGADVERLLAAGVPVNARAGDASTALISASQAGHTEVVKVLIAAGAEPDARAKKGITALTQATQSGHSEIVEALLDAGADPDLARDDGTTPLLIASQFNDLDVLDALLKAGADVNAKRQDGSVALIPAAAAGNIEVTSRLLDAGADVKAMNGNGATALYAAVSTGRPDLVKLLIDAGSDVNTKAKGGFTPLIQAVLRPGNRGVVDLLLGNGAAVDDTSDDGTTALMAAAHSGDVEVVTELVRARANVNARRSHGATALHNAAAGGHSEIIKALVAANADIDAKAASSTKEGRNEATALEVAAHLGHRDAVRVLLAAGPDLTAASNPIPLAINMIQSKLVEGGFGSLVVDGELGSKTRDAFARYQKTAGLDVTGDPDPPTLRLLFFESKDASAAANGEQLASASHPSIARDQPQKPDQEVSEAERQVIYYKAIGKDLVAAVELGKTLQRMAPQVNLSVKIVGDKLIPLAADLERPGSYGADLRKLEKQLRKGANQALVVIQGFKAPTTAPDGYDALQWRLIQGPGEPGEVVPAYQRGRTLLSYCEANGLVEACDLLRQFPGPD